jgi:lipoate-protein ligase B
MLACTTSGRIEQEGEIGASMRPWLCVELLSMDYHEALELQHKLVDAKIAGALGPDVLLLLEHPPVFTLGRRGSREHLLVAEALLESRGVQLIHVERGGDITYHGPGQLVSYPIVDLRRGHWRVIDFVAALEQVMIHTLAEWRIKAGRNPVNRGVWVGMSKVGSVGIAVRRGVSYHGFALNVNTWLEPFSWIHPCGLEGVELTSMKDLLGREVPMEDLRRAVGFHMQTIFGVELERVNLMDIYRLLATRDHALGGEAI